MTHAAGPSSAARQEPAASASLTARLFDADRPDTELALEDALRRRIGRNQLLWIDIEGSPDAVDLDRIARRLELAPDTRALLAGDRQGSGLAIHGAYAHIRVAAASRNDPGRQDGDLDVVVSPSFVLSRHPLPIDALRELVDRLHDDSLVGSLRGASLAAMLLTAVVTGYQQAVDVIEAQVDDLDTRALRASRDDDRVLADLVALRRRIAALRRLLTDQREAYTMLDGAETLRSMGERSSSDLQAVTGRFEAALGSVEDARDLLLGSFDVFMTRTAQRTNESMKILTLATVLLLPGSLIAGLLGMNLQIPLSEDGGSFWVVVLLVAALAATILVVARARRWV